MVLYLDPDTGKTTKRLVLPQPWVQVLKSPKYIGVDGNVYLSDDLDKPLGKLAHVRVRDFLVLSEDRWAKLEHSQSGRDWLANDRVTVASIGSNRERSFAIPFSSNVLPSQDGHLVLVTEQEQLMRLDVTTGDLSTILDVRKGYVLFFRVAVWGVLLVFGTWLFVACRKAATNPLVEWLWISGMACVALGVWGPQADDSELVLTVANTCAIVVFLFVLVLLALNVRAWIAHGIPILLLGVAGIMRWYFFCHGVPRYDDGFEFVMLSVCVILLLGLSAYAFLLRRCAGFCKTVLPSSPLHRGSLPLFSASF